MEQDILNFLPKYPNIEQFTEDVFNPYEEDFYEALYKKKEFYDNKLEKTEEFPKQAGDLLKHQKLIARFFSSQTLYDELLMVHEMGTGKSCSAVGAVEQIRSEGGGFKGALYLAKGDAMINNFINELIFKCTDGRYIPEDYEQLTELEKVHRKKKAIRDYYNLNTFETFAKEIRKSSDELLQQRYNNRVIIVDEIHNLRIQKKQAGLNIYEQFHRFLHVVQDCKILLMSGTPMKDGVDEIASVMNLILPMDSQLPTEEEFLDEFFDYKGDDVFTVKENKKKILKDLFKGRVSYLKAMQSNVKKVFAGEHTGALTHFKVVDDYMETFQSEVYDLAYTLDREERQGVYSNSRQASLFVFPDKTYGDIGFKKYVRKTPMGQAILDDGKKKRTYRFTLQPELVSLIKDDSKEKMLSNLAKYSSKYAASIRNILRAQQEGKLVFVYNEFVSGSGLILFGALLELFGFSSASGMEGVGVEKPRYTSLTNETSTTKKIRQLIDRFNQPDNIHGKIINVIMGSRKIAEGFSFQNIQVEEIHTPWFNYSETAQAIARGYRLGSHRMLLETGVVPELEIFQRVSISSGSEPSIDLEMYEIAENKDISIKGVERIIRESAWDCALNYNRNHITGYDGERECDYMSCEYTCNGIPADMIESSISNNELDYSTFQLYYAHPNIRKIINDLKLIFRDTFRIDLVSIIDYFVEYSGFELISALRTMINESIPIINKYGYTSYLKEQNNIYFIVNNLSVIGTLLSDYYTEYPHIMNPIVFSKVVQPLYVGSFPNIVNQINNATTLEDVRKIMIRLPKQVHEFFIESSILARKKNINVNVTVRDLILQYFENYYTEFDGVWVSWLMYDDEDTIRCLEGEQWKDCGEEYKELLKEYKDQLRVDLEQNPYGYYGQFNRGTDDFCIRDVSEEIPEKGHLVKSGRRCNNWKKPDLLPVIINALQMPIPSEQEMSDSNPRELAKWNKIKEISKDKIIAEINKNKYINDFFSIQELNSKSTEELRRILFWGQRQVKPICTYLRNWFEQNNLLVENEYCGTRGPKN